MSLAKLKEANSAIGDFARHPLQSALCLLGEFAALELTYDGARQLGDVSTHDTAAVEVVRGSIGAAEVAVGVVGGGLTALAIFYRMRDWALERRRMAASKQNRAFIAQDRERVLIEARQTPQQLVEV